MTDTRDKLETLAADLVQQDGLGSFSFRTLAEQVGVKSASVHYHFPAKSDLARRLIAGYSADFRDQLTTIGAEQVSLRVKLERLVAVFESVLKQDKLCLCGALAAELGSLDEASQRLLRRYFRDSEEWIEEVLEKHPEEIRAEIPASQLARVLLSGLEGAVLLDRVDGGRQRLDAMRDLVRSVTA